MFTLAARSRPQSASYASLHRASVCLGHRGLMGAPPFAPTRRAQPLCSEPPYLGAGVRDSLSPCTHGYSLCTSIHLTDHLGTYPGSAVLPPSPTALTSSTSSELPLARRPTVANHCPVSKTGVMHTPSSSTSVVLWPAKAGVACGSLLADRRSKRLSGLSYSADARHLHRLPLRLLPSSLAFV